MAIFDSAVITRASGSVGGLTFSHNRGGNYIKARSNPTNPNTPQQQTIRTVLADLSNLWANLLDAADRQKWEDYAAAVPVVNALGASIFLTGMNMYVRSNVSRGQATDVGLTLPRVDIAPSIFNIGSFTSVSITASAATDSISLSFEETDAWVDVDDAALLLYSARPQQDTINYFKGPYRFSGAVLGDSVAAPTSPQGIQAQFPFDEGQKIFVRVRLSDADGRLSADQLLSTIATA